MGVKTTGKKHAGRTALIGGIAVLACICAGVLLAGTAGREEEARVTYRFPGRERPDHHGDHPVRKHAAAGASGRRTFFHAAQR